MEEKTEQPILQPRPISGHHASIDDEEVGAAPTADANYLSSHARLHLLLCGLCIAILLLIGVVAVILAFTVFRVQDPTLTMNRVLVDRIQIVGDGSPTSPLSVNATLVADFSVRNPNIATLHFGNSVTEYYIEGRAVGSGWAPGFRVTAKETERMNVSARVVADRVVLLVGSVSVSGGKGIVRMTSRTEVVGRVNVLGVFRRDVGVTMGCTMRLDSNRSAEVAGSRDCVANVK